MAVNLNNVFYIFFSLTDYRVGFDGRLNHNALHIFDCETLCWVDAPEIKGIPPLGRNGHSATYANGKLFILGGWLGTGPHAASDLHILHIQDGRWEEPEVVGDAPGPMNMHSADYMSSSNTILVFRGGDGRQYLNDLHAFHVDTLLWEKVETEGQAPTARANHASSVAQNKLFIFGGWDGSRRLNDMHVLNTGKLNETAWREIMWEI